MRMSDAVPGPDNAGAAPSTLALIVILSAQLMVVLDFSIVNVALPSIQRELGFSPSGEQWVVTAYAIAFGGLLILGGRAGDVFGLGAHRETGSAPDRARDVEAASEATHRPG
jgi:MFS family permease